MSERRVYVRHLRSAGYCLIPGGREWFEHHNLDWRSFIKNGIELETLQRIDDVMCQRVCREALKEYDNGPDNRV